MDSLTVTKKVVSLIVGSGAAKIISGVVKNNTDPTKVIDKVTIVCGSYVLGAIVAEATSDWTDAKIDELVAQYRKQIEKFKNK